MNWREYKDGVVVKIVDQLGSWHLSCYLLKKTSAILLEVIRFLSRDLNLTPPNIRSTSTRPTTKSGRAVVKVSNDDTVCVCQ